MFAALDGGLALDRADKTTLFHAIRDANPGGSAIPGEHHIIIEIDR